MSEFNKGDRVVVIGSPRGYEGEVPFGGLGVVLEDGSTVPYVDMDSGKRYCFMDDKLKHYTPVEDLPLWKSNHMYLNNEQQQVLRKLLHRVQWDEEYAEKIRFGGVSSNTITDAFTWGYTEEGREFWESVNDQCYNEEIQQPDEIRSRATGRVVDDLCPPVTSCTIIIDGMNNTSEYFLQRAIDLQQERGKTSKSDGGSSDYYKLKIVRAEDGSSFECELGDLIYSVFGGDFNLGNIVKACRRAWLQSKGCGKHGVTIEYDMNKIGWFSKDHAARTKQADSGAL